MNKLLIAAALAAATLLGNASARPAPEAKLQDVLRPADYGSWYCEKLNDRCNKGDANACKLLLKNCGGA